MKLILIQLAMVAHGTAEVFFDFYHKLSEANRELSHSFTPETRDSRLLQSVLGEYIREDELSSMMFADRWVFEYELREHPVKGG